MRVGTREGIERVALLVRDPHSSSSRVRFLQYLPAFEASGIETRVLGWQVGSRRDVMRYARDATRLARWADVVVLQKPAQPPWLLRMLAKASPLVVDLDDAVWVSGGRRGEETDASRRLGGRLRVALELGDGAIVGSGWLADRVGELAPGVNVEVIRSSVDTRRYDRTPAPVRNGPPTIGWIGSAGNLGDFTTDALDGIRPLVERGDARLVIVSGAPVQLDGIDVDFVEWSEDGEVAAVRSFDVGVMPLHDDERSRGRCGYKAIQCLAAGAPVVASRVGSAAEMVHDGETGYVVSDAGGWERALAHLVDNAADRRRMGENGRAWVVANADVATSFPRLMSVLAQARATAGGR